MNDEELLKCKEKASSGNPDAIIKLADYYLEIGDKEKAFLAITRFSYVNSVIGKRKLGYFYHYGIGCEIDIEKALFYYRIAYEQGDYISGYNIALILLKEEKYDECIPYLTFGMMNNHVNSIKLLASFYLKGFGIDVNQNIAINLYSRCIELGDNSCYNKIGMIYYQNGECDLAVQYFQKAADLMDLDGIYHLAICYSKGQGVPMDEIKAVHLYEIAANNNHLKSIYNLAIHYQNGIGVEKDLDKANQLFELHLKMKNVKIDL